MGFTLIVLLVAWAVVTVARPVSPLVKIHVVLTVLVIVGYVAHLGMRVWLHSMAYSDPVRKHWEPTYGLTGEILWYGALIPWVIVTVFHIVVVMRGKTRTDY
jgi:hypothetical protein